MTIEERYKILAAIQRVIDTAKTFQVSLNEQAMGAMFNALDYLDGVEKSLPPLSSYPKKASL